MSEPKFFLSIKDETIVKEIQRDPLGWQPIWSYFGSRIVPHLTASSSDLRCFNILLANLYLSWRYIDQNPGLQSFIYGNEQIDGLNGLILVFEQLLLYSIKKRESDPKYASDTMTGIPGLQNASKKYEKENWNPLVGPFLTVLKNQLGLGIHGRYKTPLISMKIISDTRRILITSFEFESEFSALADLESKLFEFYDRLKSKRGDPSVRFKEFRGTDEILKLLDVSPGMKKFWKSRLLGDKDTIIHKLYDSLDSDSQSGNSMEVTRQNPDWRNIVINMGKILPEGQRREVENVFYLEEYLCRIDLVFDMLFNSECDIIMQNLKTLGLEQKHAELSNLKADLKGEIEVRLKLLMNCDPTSPDFIRQLIDYHKHVSEFKGVGSWVEFDAVRNKVEKLNTSYLPEPYKPGTPVNWRRQYYINTLYYIKEALG